MEFRADLHCHSYFSDGTDSPEELIRLAKEAHLSALSITDHDTIEAYSHIPPFIDKEGFSLIPGVEFSAFYKKEAIHVLGYGFSLKNQELLDLCLRHQIRRKKRNLKILENLRKLGISVEESELFSEEGERTIGRPKIAEILMQKNIVSSIKEAFDKYLAEGKAAYESGEVITVQETIEVIHKAKGLAILAHPHLIKRKRVVKELTDLPFDGLEGYYARFPKEEEQKWVDLAKKKKWIITGGSDYHGTIKPYNILGSSWVGKETFDIICTHYEKSSAS